MLSLSFTACLLLKHKHTSSLDFERGRKLCKASFPPAGLGYGSSTSHPHSIGRGRRKWSAHVSSPAPVPAPQRSPSAEDVPGGGTLCSVLSQKSISWASWTRRKLGTWKFTAPSLRAVWYTGKSLNVTKLTLKLVKPGQQYCKFLKGYYVTLIKDALSKKQLISLKTMAIVFPSVKIIVFLEICPPSDSFSRLIRSLEQTTLSILS